MSQISLDRMPSRAPADRSGFLDVREHWDALLGAVRMKSVGGSGRYHRGIPPVERETVSVVIPCYNYGRYLPDAVASVLRQDLVDVEVIIVDDASTDDSVAVARELSDADPRVRLIEHSENRGHIATYNEGLSEVSGDYVVLMSADDQLAPGSLARALAVFQAMPEVGLVYGSVELFSQSEAAHAFWAEAIEGTPWDWIAWKGDESAREVCRYGRNVIRSPEVVLRRDVYEATGGYDSSLPHVADLAMWLRSSRLGAVARVLGTPQALYRIHDASMHWTTGGVAELTERRRGFASSLDEADQRELRQTVFAALAGQALHGAAWALEANAGDQLSAELEAFARESVEDYSTLPGWRAVRRRRRIGALPEAVGSRVMRTLLLKRRWRDALERRFWQWRGI